jgi:hypothetical protein
MELKMNDEKLKSFLKENSRVPESPAGEWSKILMKIESGKQSGLFNMKKISLGFASFAVLSLVVLNTIKPHQTDHSTAKLKEINTYLVADSYFSENETEYSWIGEL